MVLSHPISGCCEKNSERVVPLLLEKKADVTLRNGENQNAFMIARDKKHTAITELLQPVGSSLHKQFLELNTAKQFRAARRALRDNFGIMRLEKELRAGGWLDAHGPKAQLTTNTQPFNIFARVGAGLQKQGQEMADMNQRFCEQTCYGDEFCIACNRPQNDEHWEDKSPEWLGVASMARRHKFMVLKDLTWTWFNVLVFGICYCDSCKGNDPLCEKCNYEAELRIAIKKMKDMKEAAKAYAKLENWSDQLGLFIHCYPHCSVNSTHLHILDLSEPGPTFWHLNFKNLPLDSAIEVLEEELNEFCRLIEAQRQKVMQQAEPEAQVEVDDDDDDDDIERSVNET